MNQKLSGEDRFLKEISAFIANERVAAIKDLADVERFIKGYQADASPKGSFLDRLSTSTAKIIRRKQRDNAPYLSEHPFFKKIDEIAKSMWSKDIQDLLGAGMFLIQQDLGVKPSLIPEARLIAMINKAKNAVIKENCKVFTSQ